MKRYTREDMSELEKVVLLKEGAEVVEICGTVMRVLGTGGHLYEIQTAFWAELKEAE